MQHLQHDKEETMDKFFLVTYTCTGYDGFRHSCHSWFETEEEMRAFVRAARARGNDMEVELSIEIVTYRKIVL